MCISGYVINPEEVRPVQRYLLVLRAKNSMPPLKPRPLGFLDVAASILVKNRKMFGFIERPIFFYTRQNTINSHILSPYIREIFITT